MGIGQSLKDLKYHSHKSFELIMRIEIFKSFLRMLSLVSDKFQETDNSEYTKASMITPWEL